MKNNFSKKRRNLFMFGGLVCLTLSFIVLLSINTKAVTETPNYINGIKLEGAENKAASSESLIVNLEDLSQSFTDVESFVFEIQNNVTTNGIAPFIVTSDGNYFEHAGFSSQGTTGLSTEQQGTETTIVSKGLDLEIGDMTVLTGIINPNKQIY